MKTCKGYVNEGKVLLGLYFCGHANCESCPYRGEYCSSRLARDCSRYLFELERRLLDYEKKENKS